MFKKIDENYIKAAEIVPSERQANWQELEFYAFCHFGINTFTNKEWGDGTDSPNAFNPTDFDAEQWVTSVKKAGMKALILTCKHHDGFCLWQTAYTDYSVKSSPFCDGKGDVVKEVSDACRKHGIKFGVYLSPWDRNNESYGKGKEYDDYYCNQLRELLTNYGEIFCVWLDGACGEGKNGKKQVYDFQRYYKLIRDLQPNAVISVMGPDVRWVGNEAGVCRKSEWSVVPSWLSVNEFTAENSQKADDKKFRKNHNQMLLDLGSRKAISGEEKLIWYPAEVDTSIRPGWFYHKSEDYKVKDLDKLFEIYIGSVGGNASLLLNIPPDKTGKINEIDALVLDSFGKRLKRQFHENISKNAKAFSSSKKDEEHSAQNVLNADLSYWQCGENKESPEIAIDFGEVKEFDSLILRENIRTGQQIENFSLYAETDGKRKKLGKYTVIGNKKIVLFKKKIRAKKLIAVINSYRVIATIRQIEVFNSKN